MNGPPTIDVTVMTMRRLLAVPGASPWPLPRKGYPQSSAKTVAPNWDEKWE